ncbi:hypothetical protein T03_12743 [Trichinella britovi]|uniref:Uncharacterized protein n=1 Tax=Trichinella britovi TaxID=45882 RepID=A0A0V1CJ23_TRIBR|nr:hypothetical protein T03_12743 [Trichinella britovi]
MVDELSQFCDEELYLDDIQKLLEAVNAFYDKTLELQLQLEAAQSKMIEFPAFLNHFQADVYCCEDLKDTKFSCLLAGLSGDALTAN